MPPRHNNGCSRFYVTMNWCWELECTLRDHIARLKKWEMRWPMRIELWPWPRQLCLVKESYKAMAGIISLVQSFANVSGI